MGLGRNCALIHNDNCSGCRADDCLRIIFLRFPPYEEVADGDPFFDYSQPEFVTCGVVVELVNLLASSIGSRCFQRVLSPHIGPQFDKNVSHFMSQVDFKMVAGIKRPAGEEAKLSEVHYPFGEILSMSIMGLDHLRPQSCIRLLAIYPVSVWISVAVSLLMLTSIVTKICIVLRRHSRRARFSAIAILWLFNLIDLMAIYLGQSVRIQSGGCIGKRKVCKSRIRNVVRLMWSAMSCLFLVQCVTNHLIEMLLHAQESDRFTSGEDLITRAGDTLEVVSFADYPLAEMVSSGRASFAKWQMITGSDGTEATLISLLPKLREGSAVIVGVAATMYYIRSVANRKLGCDECISNFYISTDRKYADLFYINTHKNRGWPRERVETWRRTSGRILESGLADIAYRSNLAAMVPELFRVEIDRRMDKFSLLVETINFKAIITIVFLTIGLFALSVVVNATEFIISFRYENRSK